MRHDRRLNSVVVSLRSLCLIRWQISLETITSLSLNLKSRNLNHLLKKVLKSYKLWQKIRSLSLRIQLHQQRTSRRHQLFKKRRNPSHFRNQRVRALLILIARKVRPKNLRRRLMKIWSLMLKNHKIWISKLTVQKNINLTRIQLAIVRNPMVHHLHSVQASPKINKSWRRNLKRCGLFLSRRKSTRLLTKRP